MRKLIRRKARSLAYFQLPVREQAYLDSIFGRRNAAFGEATRWNQPGGTYTVKVENKGRMKRYYASRKNRHRKAKSGTGD